MTAKTKNNKSNGSGRNTSEQGGLYVAGMVLGIIGVVFAFIPFMYWLAYIMGLLALIFGIIGLTKKSEGHTALTATVLGAVALVVGIIMHIVIIQSVATIIDGWGDGVSDAMSDFLDDYESDIVGKYAEVTFEGWQEVDDPRTDHALVVTVKNISDRTKSFVFGLEALDANGDRLDEFSFTVENLAPGQSQRFNTFILTKLGDDIMSSATYNVYQSSTF